MLTKQALKNSITISINSIIIDKDQIIEMSKDWTEKEETLFRKMLKQGGHFSIRGNKFNIKTDDFEIESQDFISSTFDNLNEEN